MVTVAAGTAGCPGGSETVEQRREVRKSAMSPSSASATGVERAAAATKGARRRRARMPA